jgi:hypothetical protein
LLADDDSAPTCPVRIGESTIGIEAVGELVGQLAQLIGAVLAAQPG